MNVLIFLTLRSKKAVLGKREKRGKSLTILLSSLVFIFSSPWKIHETFIITSFLCLPWAPAFFYQSTSFAPPHRKTHWTMSVNNVGLKICLLGCLKLHGHPNMFSLIWSEVVMGQVQQPITNFTGPWDDFTVHGCNTLPLRGVLFPRVWSGPKCERTYVGVNLIRATWTS